MVALKIVKNDETYKMQAISELKILWFLLEKDLDDSNNVVHMKEHFEFRGHT